MNFECSDIIINLSVGYTLKVKKKTWKEFYNSINCIMKVTILTL